MAERGLDTIVAARGTSRYGAGARLACSSDDDPTLVRTGLRQRRDREDAPPWDRSVPGAPPYRSCPFLAATGEPTPDPRHRDGPGHVARRASGAPERVSGTPTGSQRGQVCARRTHPIG